MNTEEAKTPVETTVLEKKPAPIGEANAVIGAPGDVIGERVSTKEKAAQ